MARSKLEGVQGRDLVVQAGDAGEIPGCRTRIPHAEAQ